MGKMVRLKPLNTVGLDKLQAVLAKQWQARQPDGYADALRVGLRGSEAEPVTQS
jgi:hypothetical protein